MTRRDAAVVIDAPAAIRDVETHRTQRALVAGLVRCVEARR